MPLEPDMTETTPKKPSFFKAFLVVGLVVGMIWASWATILPGNQLSTSTLRTSFNRLSSTELSASIPEAGKLILEAGPSNFLNEAEVFAITLSSSQATPTNSTPFTLDSAFTPIFNLVNPDNSDEVILAFTFPENHFRNATQRIAELSFSTSSEGQFTIESVFFGSLPDVSFPPFQDYSIFIESPAVLFDASGLGRQPSSTTTNPPGTHNPPQATPACADGADNDGDGLTDHPADPGCEDQLDDDEEDPAPDQLRLEIASQFLERIRTPELKIELLVVLPPAQEELEYQFQMEASGGAGNITFNVRGKTPESNGNYALGSSGLFLQPDGKVIGAGAQLNAGNYRFPLQITDGSDTLNFSLQVSVNDPFGAAVGLILESSFTGTEQECLVGEQCRATFTASSGIPPYTYGFSGELPLESGFLQVSGGEAFYDFVPTAENIGSYAITLSAFDSDERVTDGSEADGSTRNTASIDFTLSIAAEEIETSFRFAAEEPCNFLDVSTIDPLYAPFTFTCRQGIIEGYQGLLRPFDTLNRAEAAKITSLILANDGAVDSSFQQFVNLPGITPVNYDDVTVSDWFADYVYYLFSEGIIIDNVIYRPADTLNVAEAMKLVVESYASLSEDVLDELEVISPYGEWYEPYQTLASYIDADIAYADPAEPAARAYIADLLYKLSRAYPVNKFL